MLYLVLDKSEVINIYVKKMLSDDLQYLSNPHVQVILENKTESSYPLGSLTFFIYHITLLLGFSACDRIQLLYRGLVDSSCAHALLWLLWNCFKIVL